MGIYRIGPGGGSPTRITSIVVVAVITLVLTAGAAAGMPGSAPDAAGDAANDGQPDEPDDAADAERADEDAEDEDAKDDEAADEAMNRSENAAAAGPDKRADDARGPAVDLPEQVPDHVHEIHAVIGEYLNGVLDRTLGERVSSVDTGEASDDGSMDDGAGNASASTPVP